MLKTAFVQGRLDRDEFDLRVGRALASRTYAGLAALAADIPARLTRARPPEAARESVNKKAVAAVACATAACIGVLPLTMLTPDGSPFAVPVIVVTFVLWMAAPTGWLLLLHDWLDKRAGRQSAQGLPPGPGSEASRRLAPANPADNSRGRVTAFITPPKPHRAAIPVISCPESVHRIEGILSAVDTRSAISAYPGPTLNLSVNFAQQDVQQQDAQPLVSAEQPRVPPSALTTSAGQRRNQVS